MQIEISELTALIAAAGNGKGVACPGVKRDLGQQIVVADRGFVYVGSVVIDGEFVTIANARNVRKWGTTKGLGELAENGPTSDTKLDAAGEVLLPLKAVIHFIKCARSW